MAEWYMRGEQYDQAKLSRILDVAQDLKVCVFLFKLINRLILMVKNNFVTYNEWLLSNIKKTCTGTKNG